MRGTLLIAFAVVTDILQGFFALAFIVMGAIPGVGIVTVPLGAGIDVTISITFGGALILMLVLSGMFYPGTILAAFVGESIPFLNVLPGWTLMAWRCVSKKRAAEGRGGTQGALLGVSLINLPGKEDGAGEQTAWGVNAVLATRRESAAPGSGAPREPRAATTRQPMVDIRPAQARTPYAQAHAA